MAEEAAAIESKSADASAAAVVADKPADPFASVKVEAAPAKVEEAKANDKKNDKTQQVIDKPAKVMAGKKGEPDLQTRVAQQNKAIADKDAKIKALEGEVGTLKSKSGGDTTALTTELQKTRDEVKRLQGELGAKDYTKHPEYQSKFQKPYEDACEDASEIFSSLMITDDDGEVRKADWDTDFPQIYRMKRDAALIYAKKAFPEDYQTVMSNYDQIHKLDKARRKSLTEWQGTATQREQQERAQSIEMQQKVAKGFEAVTNSLREQDPMFQEKPDDAEHSDLWKKSQSIVDQAYFERHKKTQAELVLLDAAIRMRAINEPILRHQLAKRDAEIIELKARIEGKAASKDGSVRHQADKIEGKEDKPWSEDLKEALASAV